MTRREVIRNLVNQRRPKTSSKRQRSTLFSLRRRLKSSKIRLMLLRKKQRQPELLPKN
jgi:hypothetical protein